MSRYKKEFLRLKNDEFLSGSFVLLIAGVLANVFLYGCHVLLGRWLVPGNYAQMQSLGALYMIVVVGFAPIRLIVCQRATLLKEDPLAALQLFIRFARNLLPFLLVALGVAWMARTWCASFLNVESAFAFFLMVLALEIGVFFDIATALLQGCMYFRGVALVTSLSAFFRFSFSAWFLWAGFGLTGALWALVLCNVVSLGMALLYMILKVKREGSLKPAPVLFPSWDYSVALQTLLANVGLSFLMQCDILYANRFLEREAAGSYAVASLFAKLLILGGQVVVQAMIPMATEASNLGRSSLLLLRKALVLAYVLMLLGIGCYIVLGRIVIVAFFGASYQHAADLLPWVSLALLPMIGLVVVSGFAMAVNSRTVGYALLTTVALFCGAVWFLTPAMPIFLSLLAAAASLALILCFAPLISAQRSAIVEKL